MSISEMSSGSHMLVICNISSTGLKHQSNPYLQMIQITQHNLALRSQNALSIVQCCNVVHARAYLLSDICHYGIPEI